MNSEKFRIRNFEFPISIPKSMVAQSKQPPYCDMCGLSFSIDEMGNYRVHAVFMDGALWGIMCDACASKLKVHHLGQETVPKQFVYSVIDALGRDAVILFF